MNNTHKSCKFKEEIIISLGSFLTNDTWLLQTWNTEGNISRCMQQPEIEVIALWMSLTILLLISVKAVFHQYPLEVL